MKYNVKFAIFCMLVCANAPISREILKIRLDNNRVALTKIDVDTSTSDDVKAKYLLEANNVQTWTVIISENDCLEFPTQHLPDSVEAKIILPKLLQFLLGNESVLSDSVQQIGVTSTNAWREEHYLTKRSNVLEMSNFLNKLDASEIDQEISEWKAYAISYHFLKPLGAFIGFGAGTSYNIASGILTNMFSSAYGSKEIIFAIVGMVIPFLYFMFLVLDVRFLKFDIAGYKIDFTSRFSPVDEIDFEGFKDNLLPVIRYFVIVKGSTFGWHTKKIEELIKGRNKTELLRKFNESVMLEVRYQLQRSLS